MRAAQPTGTRTVRLCVLRGGLRSGAIRSEAGGEARQQRRLHGRLQGLVRGQSRKISVPTALGAGEQLAPRPALRLRPAIQSGTARVEQMKELSWPHRRASRGGRRRVRPRGRASSRGGSAALASAVPPARGSKHRAPGPPLLPPTPPIGERQSLALPRGQGSEPG